MLRYLILPACIVLFCAAAQANTPHSLGSFDFKVKAGANIGGSAPMGIPAQIREIKSFNPLISLNIGANAAYWFAERWGVASGIRFENKSMTTIARVKEYNIHLQQDGGEIAGLFTGDVLTNVKNGYLTVPLTAFYSILPQLTIHAGLYYGYLLVPSFDGSVYDGYLRQGQPRQEYNMNIPKDEPSNFLFSNELATHDFGMTAGVEWNITQHFLLSLDLNWGILPIFPKSFSGITIPLYNVYTSVEFGYLF